MTKSELIQIVKNRVYQNSSKEITGKALQDTLLDIIDECYNEESSDNVVINSAEDTSLDTKIALSRHIDIMANNNVSLQGSTALIYSPLITLDGALPQGNAINIGTNNSASINIGSREAPYTQIMSLNTDISSSNRLSLSGGSTVEIASMDRLALNGNSLHMSTGPFGEITMQPFGQTTVIGTDISLQSKTGVGHITLDENSDIEVKANNTVFNISSNLGVFKIDNAIEITKDEDGVGYDINIHEGIIDKLKHLLGIDNESFD